MEPRPITVLGIDPGITGAYALLNVSDNRLIRTRMFPLMELRVKNHRTVGKATRMERFYDRQRLISDLMDCRDRLTDESSVVYLEKVHSRPGEGAAMAFKFGDCYGQLKMVLECLDFRFIEVPPQAWCKEMHKGFSGKDAKAKSRQVFDRLFPTVKDQFPNQVPDGIVDACLIAEYGRRRIEMELDLWRFNNERA